MEPSKQSKLECIIIETSWIFHHLEPIPFSLEKSNRQNIPLRSLQCYSIYHSQNSIEFGINSCFIMKSFYVRNGFSEASTADYPQNVEIEWANWCANVHIRWPLKRNTSKSNEKKHMYAYAICTALSYYSCQACPSGRMWLRFGWCSTQWFETPNVECRIQYYLFHFCGDDGGVVCCDALHLI